MGEFGKMSPHPEPGPDLGRDNRDPLALIDGLLSGSIPWPSSVTDTMNSARRVRQGFQSRERLLQ